MVTSKAVVVSRAEAEGAKSGYRNGIETRTYELPELQQNQVLVRIYAAGFNHRELWIRKGRFPDIKVGAVYGSDGAGIVISSPKPSDPFLHKRVFLTPSHGWNSDPDRPESRFGFVGGSGYPALGTFAQYVVVDRDEIMEIPDHLDFEQAAAWPLAAVTAWRAIITKGQVKSGQNVLITGIGGGVALTALQICVACGVTVYVTSSDKAKIEKAIKMGAKGGVDYNSESWAAELVELLGRDSPDQPRFDVIIDGAGGDIFKKLTRHGLKKGAKVVCYGMTASPHMDFTMLEVLANIELKGSTLGSRAELKDATAFMAKHRIAPVVSHVVHGLDRAEEGFELLASGKHFGKVVIRVADNRANKL